MTLGSRRGLTSWDAPTTPLDGACCRTSASTGEAGAEGELFLPVNAARNDFMMVLARRDNGPAQHARAADLFQQSNDNTDDGLTKRPSGAVLTEQQLKTTGND